MFTPCNYIPGDVSDDDSGSVDVMDEPQSPEVAKRLAKLKELNDAYNISDEDFEMTTSPVKTKRVRKKRGAKATPKTVSHSSHTVNTILDTWNDGTEYGQSFRKLNSEEQQAEVIRLNKGAAKGLKMVIKTKVLDVNYKFMLGEKLRAHLSESRTSMASMFHAATVKINAVSINPNFISVGEWVEIDADRTPGFNSEGGIAVIINVHDALVDVK